MKFYVHYFGCRANQAEIQGWILDLENFGYELTDNQNEADFAILNTCSVTEKAEREVIRYINKTYKKTNIPWIIAGCTVNSSGSDLCGHYHNYYFLDNAAKENLPEFVCRTFPVSNNIIFHSAFRSRIFLKVQDGCNFRCSYCIVPLLRGKSRSIEPETVLKRASYYASLGYREIILTGINLSSYGFDLFPRRNLLDLIKKINQIPEIDFLRLSSLDPRYLNFEFIKELSLLEKIVPSFHLSFQSGSNTVLQRMKRSSRSEDYKKLMDIFGRFFPGANMGTDFIAGFPEESEKEFQETCEFIKSSQLNYMHVFPYSPRPGTRAELMDPVPQHIVKHRVGILKALNRSMRTRYREQCTGKILQGIVIEETPHYALVVTDNFLTVRIPPLKGYRQKKISLQIQRVLNENMCEGEMVKLADACCSQK